MTKNHNNKTSRKSFIKSQLSGLAALGLTTAVGSVVRGMITPTDSESTLATLGRTGMKVTPLGMGASRTMEVALIKTAMDKGINFLDTGPSYFNGQNEVVVGKAIAGRRDKVIIQSKVKIDSAKLKKDSTIITKMNSSLEASLEAMQTDYIDIFLLHGANSINVIHNYAVMQFFTKAREKGQIRACGFSSHTNQVELLKAQNKDHFYDVVMVPYNHLGSYEHQNSDGNRAWDQAALEMELIKAADAETGIVAMKTCLGGPYAFEGEPVPSFPSAVKWVLQKPYIHTTAVAMANFVQLDENLTPMV